MRRLLNSARQIEVNSRVVRYAGGETPLEGMQRKAMIRHVKLAAERYGLQADIDAYLAVADCASLAGLDLSQLRALASWVGSAMDRLATACDSPDAPPAR